MTEIAKRKVQKYIDRVNMQDIRRDIQGHHKNKSEDLSSHFFLKRHQTELADKLNTPLLSSKMKTPYKTAIKDLENVTDIDSSEAATYHIPLTDLCKDSMFVLGLSAQFIVFVGLSSL